MIAPFQSSIRAFVDKYTAAVWEIGIVQFNESLDILDTKWVKNEFKDRWFADPFILHMNEKETILLVEDYVYGTNKGTISKLVINNSTMTIVSRVSLLEATTHLSFPFIYRKGPETFIIPENGKAGHLTCYRLYDDKLEECSILYDRPIADAAIFDNNERHFILCTEQFRCNKNIVTVLASNTFPGKFEKVDEITLSDNSARSAGTIFKMNKMAIRPAQICNNDYGEALCFQEIKVGTDGRLNLQELRRVYPQCCSNLNGIHTFNIADDISMIAAIDGFHYNSLFFRKAYPRFIKLRKVIKR